MASSSVTQPAAGAPRRPPGTDEQIDLATLGGAIRFSYELLRARMAPAAPIFYEEVAHST
jgi:hypothetical protein